MSWLKRIWAIMDGAFSEVGPSLLPINIRAVICASDKRRDSRQERQNWQQDSAAEPALDCGWRYREHGLGPFKPEPGKHTACLEFPNIVRAVRGSSVPARWHSA